MQMIQPTTLRTAAHYQVSNKRLVWNKRRGQEFQSIQISEQEQDNCKAGLVLGIFQNAGAVFFTKESWLVPISTQNLKILDAKCDVLKFSGCQAAVAPMLTHALSLALCWTFLTWKIYVCTCKKFFHNGHVKFTKFFLAGVLQLITTMLIVGVKLHQSEFEMAFFIFKQRGL